MSLNLEVSILGEYRNLTKATKGATKQLQGLQTSAKSISRGINTALAAIGVGISFNALKSGIQSVVQEASNLEQNIGAAQIIFGEFSKQIIEDSKAAAQQFGISANDYLTSANLIQSQLKGYGLSQEEATEQTGLLVERAADLAATFGGTTLDAVKALSAVFRTEFNQIERYGVTLRKSDINARLAARGQDKLTGELLKQAEAAAALELIFEKTNDAQGQNAREAETLAGATARVQASFANARAEIGEGFAPAISAVATFINQNIGVFQELADAVGERLRAAFESTGGAAESFGAKVISAVTDLTDFLNGNAKAGNQFSQTANQLAPLIDLLGAFGELLKGIALVFDGLAVGLFGWIEELSGGRIPIQSFADVVRALGLLLQEIGRQFGIIASFFIPLTTGFKALGTLLKGLRNPFKAVGDAVATVGKDWLKFVAAFKSGGSVAGRVGKETDLAFGVIRSGIGKTRDEFNTYTSQLDKQDNRRIRNYIDVITTQYTATSNGPLIPASNTNDPASRFPLNPKPGQVYTWYNYSDRQNPDLAVWWTQTWTGTEWTKPKRMTYDSGNGAPSVSTTQEEDPAVTLFKKKVSNIVEKLRTALEDSRDRLRKAATNFRDAVQLSFGIITNGAFAVFDVNRIIRQMQRIKDAAATFADDIRALQAQGADQSLIDQLLGMDPISGATAARGLLSSGRLEEFLKLRDELSGIGTSAAQAANQNLYGGGTSELATAIQKLSRVIEKGAGNTYNINMANTSKLTAKQIIDAIKSYEKTTGTKVFSN